MDLAAGLVVADRFRLIRPLGKGGMGAVWLAQQTALDVPCALKFIHEEAARSTEIRARFEREAKAAAQLRSPHVVQILDHGVWDGMPYIAMEHLEGEDLGQRLRRRSPLPPREVLAIAVQIGRALTRAQAAGLVHRDLKPSNVFLVADEEREIAKVLDFGVAKVKETGVDERTKTGALLGTPFYMSPEQARGRGDLDHRSDLWSLAVLVFRCIVGRLPFESDSLGDLLMVIMIEAPPVPSHTADVPPGFDAWWARAVQRDPDRRFQSARELTDALGVALGLTLPESADVGARASDPPPPLSGPVSGPAQRISLVTASIPLVTASIPGAPATALRATGSGAVGPSDTLALPTPAPGSSPLSPLSSPALSVSQAASPVSSRAPSSSSIGPLMPATLSGGPAPRPRTPTAAVVAGAVALFAVGGLVAFLALRGRTEAPVAPPGAPTSVAAALAPTAAATSVPAAIAPTSAPAAAVATSIPTSAPAAAPTSVPVAAAPTGVFAGAKAPAPPASGDTSKRAPPTAKRGGAPASTAHEDFGF